LKSVCVFCGSRFGARPEYRAEAMALGRALAARDLTLVYGGGSVGLMGCVADAVLAAGGRVIGVIPEALATKEVAHAGLTELRVVPSMHARKAQMAELADAFVGLPGGFGTFEELFEIVTWAQLGLHAKPVGLLNTAGFFDSLLGLVDHAVREGFILARHRESLVTAASASDLLDRLETRRPQPSPPLVTPRET
jgi:uncharacterized protein (TIGR00730 family)